MAHWRFLVFPKPDCTDPAGLRVAELLADFGFDAVRTVRSARIFTIGLPETDADHRAVPERIARELLTDPVVETCRIHCEGEPLAEPEDALAVEIHFRPGVMDNVADSTLAALRDWGIDVGGVQTARRFEIVPPPDAADLPRIRSLLGNDCVHEIVLGTRPPAAAPLPKSEPFALRRVAIRNLADPALERLSREGHLFLSLDEMRAIRAHFRGLDRDPTDLELEAIAQTWSEHCGHKTLTASIEYRGAPFPLDDDDATETTRRYANLLKDTIGRATDELMAERRGPHCLSVFKDNAGIIAFDGDYGIAFKVETHNHPSAIEPYGGAATGIGGCIRDILGCGLGAKPIANTDVFCCAPPDWPIDAVPSGVIHPRAVLKGVVAGIRDYGNRMGIPTVNGAVHFDPRYLGNPLVYCGCVGLIPRNRIEKAPRPGDAIVLVGGRTGRDGIHGATFSSAELTDTHADEFAHAVQIGNPIEEKKVLDLVLQARDHAVHPLFSAITDCGAGGLSSAIGEMARSTGARVDLERVPLKYKGLRYDEIWISEAQERMVLAVPPRDVDAFLALARGEDVEATVIGSFTDTGRLVVRYAQTEVGDLDLTFLHDGLPRKTLIAEWQPEHPDAAGAADADRHDADLAARLKRRLADPATASKHWIIRQYDHEVQGRSVVKPLAGPGDGPSDAAVIRPRVDSDRGIAIGCGLAPDLYDLDPYLMAVAGIDEALRNVVCVGGDPERTAILDNFCWPRVDDPRNLGALVRACQACHDVARAYGLPFISGKDSLNNEFALDPADVKMLRRVMEERRVPRPHSHRVPRPRLRGRASRENLTSARRVGTAHPVGGSHNQLRRADPADPIRDGRLAIPGTLLISAVSIIDNIHDCVTMDLKQTHAQLFLIGRPTSFARIPRRCSSGVPRPRLRGRAQVPQADWPGRASPQDPISTDPSPPRREVPFDLAVAARVHRLVAHLIRDHLVVAVHDVSDGGPLVTCAEMAIAGNRDCHVHIPGARTEDDAEPNPAPHRSDTESDCAADFYFTASPALYVVEVCNERSDEFMRHARGVPISPLATVGDPRPAERHLFAFDDPAAPGGTHELELAALRRTWRSPLDW